LCTFRFDVIRRGTLPGRRVLESYRYSLSPDLDAAGACRLCVRIPGRVDRRITAQGSSSAASCRWSRPRRVAANQRTRSALGAGAMTRSTRRTDARSPLPAPS